MSTHNIGFYEEMANIIIQLSSNTLYVLLMHNICFYGEMLKKYPKKSLSSLSFSISTPDFPLFTIYMRRFIRKHVFCICENKDAQLIGAFVFATQIVQSLYFLNPKFQASSHPLRLHNSVCVGPGRNLEDWFSHDTAHYHVRRKSGVLSV